MYIVVSNYDYTTYGPFHDEQTAIDWGKAKEWIKGYSVRILHVP